MRLLCTIPFLLVVCACEHSSIRKLPNSEHPSMLVGASYAAASDAILISVSSTDHTICIDAEDWPVSEGVFSLSRIRSPITVSRGKDTFTLLFVRLDGGRREPIRLSPNKTITATIPLQSFDGLEQWTGAETILYMPKITSCS